MENKNNNKGVIALLIVIIIILATLCVLFATGTISFNSSKVNDNNAVGDVDNSDANQESDEIETSLLNDLYSIIGILPVDQYYRNNCLNISISNNNYKGNVNKIFSWYAYLHGMETYHYNDSKCQADNDCLIAYSAAASRTISKEDANEIAELYNFDIKTLNFLNPLSSYDDEYSYATQVGDPPSCDYSIKHDTNSKYLNSTDIRIIDKQDIIEYEFGSDKTDNNIKSTKNQTVTYDFKKNNEGNYYLDKVMVE